MEYVPFLRFQAQSTEAVIAISAGMLVVGLLSLLYGWKLYKAVLVVTCGLAAGYLGWYFLHNRLPPNIAFLAPLFIGLLGALAAIPIQKAVVFLLGATVGFVSLGPVLAQLIWTHPPGPTPMQYLLVSAGTFVVMGISALLLFKPLMVIATALFGATLLLSAGVHLVEALATRRVNLYSRYATELAWIYAAVAVVGVLFQAAVLRKRRGIRE